MEPENNLVVACPDCGKKNRVDRDRVGPESKEKPICGGCKFDLDPTVAVYTQGPTAASSSVPGVDAAPGVVPGVGPVASGPLPGTATAAPEGDSVPMEPFGSQPNVPPTIPPTS